MIRKRKPEMATVTFRMNKKIWKEAKKSLDEIGVSRSQFISLVLTEVVREAQEGDEEEMIDRIKEALTWMGMNMMVRKKE